MPLDREPAAAPSGSTADMLPQRFHHIFDGGPKEVYTAARVCRRLCHPLKYFIQASVATLRRQMAADSLGKVNPKLTQREDLGSGRHRSRRVTLL